MKAADRELERLIDLARRAASVVMKGYEAHRLGALDVGEKGPGDPVTEADRAANDLICAALERDFPGEAIIAEESVPGDQELRRRLAAPRVFFVDPLDGTRELVEHRTEFAVMIGIAELGRATAGVVAIPAEGGVLAGRVGRGALLEDRGGARREVRVSTCARFPDANLIVSRSHISPLVEPLRRRLGIQRSEPCGSVGVKVARVVERAADLYVHEGPGMKLWDTCAPEAILEAAGGRFTDLGGRLLDYGRLPLSVDGLVASNGVLHAGVLSAVGWAQREAQRVAARGHEGGGNG